MTAVIPSLFGLLNAKHLTAVEVASTFVPPPQYWELLRREHSLVIGPRGSGKTTLLTMLQLDAVDAWRAEEAEKARTLLDSVAVLVPTDVAWSEQLKALERANVNSSVARAIVNATAVTHALRALVRAFGQFFRHGRSFPSLADRSPSPTTESRLCSRLSEVWALPSWSPTLEAVHASLGVRIRDLGAQVKRAARLLGGGPSLRTEDAFYDWDLIDAVSNGLDCFSEATGQMPTRWSLLFDELELAPSFVLQDLVRALRSRDGRIVLKLSLSPFSPDLGDLFTSGDSPHVGHDFHVLRLWYEEKQTGTPFSRRLTESLLVRAGLSDIAPLQLFGTSAFEAGSTSAKRRPGGARGVMSWERRFGALSRIDPSFARFLRGEGLTPERLSGMNEAERAEHVRRFAALVPVREAALRESAGLRSRKVREIYAGLPTLLEILEGNPRLLIGVLRRLIGKIDGRTSIPLRIQARELEAAGDRFRALLSTIPVFLPPSGREASVLRILDAIADGLFKRIVQEPFNAEPPESFVVDSGSPAALLEALGAAVNAGAIVYVPDGGGLGAENFGLLVRPTSLKGKRFRLSYLLAAYRGLPIRLGRAVSLSTLIGRIRSDEDEWQRELPLAEDQ